MVRPVARALARAGLLAAVLAASLVSSPAVAPALTRTQVLERANSWIARRVSYSQYRFYRGYRRDCSGFVSMAWGLKRSYSSRTISSRARRIRVSDLKPGDAVLVRGHVSLFGGWKDRRARTYWALEQTTWGSHAKKRVRRIPRHAHALRFKGLTPPPLRKAVLARPAAARAALVTEASRESTATVVSASALSR